MKRALGILGIIVTVVFLYFGITIKVPDKYIKSYGTDKMTEYVGGDAYNFIIEASLRGGEIAGAMTAKAIYFGVAAILGAFSFYCMSDIESENLKKDFYDLRKEVKNIAFLIDERTEPSDQKEAINQSMVAEEDNPASQPEDS